MSFWDLVTVGRYQPKIFILYLTIFVQRFSWLRLCIFHNSLRNWLGGHGFTKGNYFIFWVSEWVSNSVCAVIAKNKQNTSESNFMSECLHFYCDFWMNIQPSIWLFVVWRYWFGRIFFTLKRMQNKIDYTFMGNSKKCNRKIFHSIWIPSKIFGGSKVKSNLIFIVATLSKSYYNTNKNNKFQHATDFRQILKQILQKISLRARR